MPSNTADQFGSWRRAKNVCAPCVRARMFTRTFAEANLGVSLPLNPGTALSLEEASFGDLFQVVPRFGTWNNNAAPN